MSRTRRAFERREPVRDSSLLVSVSDPRFYERRHVEHAIERAISLDIDPDKRWCDQLCTRVYRVVERILAYSENR